MGFKRIPPKQTPPTKVEKIEVADKHSFEDAKKRPLEELNKRPLEEYVVKPPKRFKVGKSFLRQWGGGGRITIVSPLRQAVNRAKAILKRELKKRKKLQCHLNGTCKKRTKAGRGVYKRGGKGRKRKR